MAEWQAVGLLIGAPVWEAVVEGRGGRFRGSTVIPRTIVALSLFLTVGCASTQAILAAQAVRAGCAPTNGESKVEFQVVDQEGAVLPGVLVSIDGPGVVNRSRRSDKEGWVSLDVPRPGRYDARLELPGFRAVKVERINVAAKCQVKLLVAMKVSARGTVVQ